MCRGDERLAREALTQTVRSGFSQQQRPRAREMLQTREIAAQLGLSMQINVVGEDVERVELEMLRGREVYISQQAIGCRAFHVFVELAQKPLYPPVAVPAHDSRGNLVAQREKQRRGVGRDLAHRSDRVAYDVSSELSVVEKWDVLRPRQSDHHPEAVPERGVEQGRGRRRVRAHRVDACGRHQDKVLLGSLCRSELRPVGIRSEGAVGHSLDQ